MAESGFDQGVIIVKGKEPKFAFNLKLKGKGLDIPDAAPPAKKFIN